MDVSFQLTKTSVINSAINEPILAIIVHRLVPLDLISVGNNSGAYRKFTCKVGLYL